MDFEIPEVEALAPVALKDGFVGKAPAPEVGPCAKTADNAPYPVLQGHDCGIVQMIPVVVGYEQKINAGHVVCSHKGRARKGPVAEKEGGSVVAEDWVDEDVFARKAQKEGGVPKPDKGVFFESAHVNPYVWQGLLRFRALPFQHEPARKGDDKVAVVRKDWCWLKIHEDAALLMRGKEYALKIFSFRQGAESRRIEKCHASCSSHGQDSAACGAALEKGSSVHAYPQRSWYRGPSTTRMTGNRLPKVAKTCPTLAQAENVRESRVPRSRRGHKKGSPGFRTFSETPDTYLFSATGSVPAWPVRRQTMP